MKIALYTIFRCTNYGAVLQACALSRTLRGILGEDSVDVINHRMDPRDNHLLGKVTNPNTPWFQRWRNRRKFVVRYFHPELFELRRQKTIRLIEEHIRPTERLYRSPCELGDLPAYDTVVVGSDQIWNPGLNHDFGRNQYLAVDLPQGQDRVAYAASFGVAELPEECREEYQAALSRFRRITVREESGAEICRELLSPGGECPQVVLDPTMLLTADDWENAAGSVPKVSGSVPKAPAGRYVAAYWVRTLTEADVSALARIARDLSAPICLMSAGPMPKFAFPPEIAPYVEADPFDFVRTFAGSAAVVTDSFHGLQFATIFRRPFAVLGNLSDPRSNASRLVDFCSRYGLSAGVQDIECFRAGTEFHFADFTSFDPTALECDRVRSLDALKGLLP